MIPNLAGVDRVLVAFFAGHQIDPLDYEKLRDAEKYGLMEKIQKDWSKALRYLNLWSQASDLTTSPTKVADLQDELSKVRIKLIELERRQESNERLAADKIVKGSDSITQRELERRRTAAGYATSNTIKGPEAITPTRTCDTSRTN